MRGTDREREPGLWGCHRLEPGFARMGFSTPDSAAVFTGKLAFAQVMDFLPLHTFRRCVQRYPSNYPTKTFSHLDQFLCMAFAQLTFRDSLRDIEAVFALMPASSITLASAAMWRAARWRMPTKSAIGAADHDFADALIATARKLYAGSRISGLISPTRSCARHDDHRSFAERLSVGAFPHHQGCGEDAHPD